MFDQGSTWCGLGCGKCYQITPTGGFIEGQGKAPTTASSQLVLVTNLCPSQYNWQWCSSPNQYGYTAHFYLMDQNMDGIVTALGWDNPEVYYQEIDCQEAQLENWEQCECYH